MNLQCKEVPFKPQTGGLTEAGKLRARIEELEAAVSTYKNQLDLLRSETRGVRARYSIDVDVIKISGRDSRKACMMEIIEMTAQELGNHEEVFFATQEERDGFLCLKTELVVLTPKGVDLLKRTVAS